MFDEDNANNADFPDLKLLKAIFETLITLLDTEGRESSEPICAALANMSKLFANTLHDFLGDIIATILVNTRKRKSITQHYNLYEELLQTYPESEVINWVLKAQEAIDNED